MDPNGTETQVDSHGMSHGSLLGMVKEAAAEQERMRDPWLEQDTGKTHSITFHPTDGSHGTCLYTFDLKQWTDQERGEQWIDALLLREKDGETTDGLRLSPKNEAGDPWSLIKVELGRIPISWNGLTDEQRDLAGFKALFESRQPPTVLESPPGRPERVFVKSPEVGWPHAPES